MNKQQLANKIWESANRMRSKIEANEYKDYILGFIFYKFLSDKEVAFLKKDGYEDADIQEHAHENNEQLVDYCQQHLGYFIAYDNLFSTWLAKGNKLHLDETTYLILALRYKELFSGGGVGPGGDDVPYEIDSYLTEINTGVIDANYMNSRFKKYIKALQDGTETAAVLDELHKSFATLTQEEQKYANIFLHDVQNGDVVVDEGKTLRDYITEYMTRAKNDQIRRFATAIGVDEAMLRSFMQLKVTEANINEFGHFDKLKATVDRTTARAFLEALEGNAIKPFQINMKLDQVLRRFILEGGFDF